MRKPYVCCFLLALLPSVVFAQSLPTSAPTDEFVAPMVRPELCGDGKFNAGERCDDGNTLNGDDCSSTCLIESCGDDILQGERGEQCDDGNTTSSDGCSSTCAVEKSHRSARFGFVLSTALSLAGIPITTFTGSPIPTIISVGIGPAVGRLYIRDYKKAGIYGGLRVAMAGIAVGGFFLAKNEFKPENIGNFIPGDAISNDRKFALGARLLVGGVLLYSVIALVDISGLLVHNAAQRRRVTMLPAPTTFGQGSLGVSLLGRF